jgi:hypothetical protein
MDTEHPTLDELDPLDQNEIEILFPGARDQWFVEMEKQGFEVDSLTFGVDSNEVLWVLYDIHDSDDSGTEEAEFYTCGDYWNDQEKAWYTQVMAIGGGTKWGKY